MKTNSESEFVGHQECPQCSSSDALGVYSDGHGYCFSCHTYFKRVEGMEAFELDPVQNINKKAELFGTITAIKDRKISLDTAKRYGVHSEKDKQHYPYYDTNGTFIGTKTREVSTKQFRATGDMRNNTLFGQQLFSSGKYITVCEGELDALATYQMLGSKFPVVSVSKGAGGAVKDFRQNLEWLEGFENVVICFDNDDAGREAATKCAEVLSPNKAKIVNLTEYKDACDYLVNNKMSDFMNRWWSAKTHQISGLITLEEAWDSFVKRGTEEIIPFPESFGMLNSMMKGGIAAGEITVLGALTSVGKTTMVNEIVYNFWQNTNKKIGCAFLEASDGEAVENLLTIHTGQNLSLEDRTNIDYDKLRSPIIYDRRIVLLRHNGAVNTEEFFTKIRGMIVGAGCEIIVIDPLQAAVTTNSNEVIDTFMDNLLKIAKETDASIILVSHMRKPSMTDAHNVNEYDLKGSGAINQIAFNTILLSRDKMADDDYARNSTKVQLVKCRRTGITGNAGWLFYNKDTGRLERGVEPEIAKADSITEF